MRRGGWIVVTALPASALALGAALALGSCSGDEVVVPATTAPSASVCAPCPCAPGSVVDATLLAFLSKARASHHQADLAEQAGDTDQAIAVLVRLVDGQVPGGTAPGPEVREVLADTLARLAELRSGIGQYDEAKQDIDRGLKLAVRRTHFRGRLMEVLGVVEERRAKALAADGDEQGAREATGRALDAFEKAIEIQAYVIEQTLTDAAVVDAAAP